MIALLQAGILALAGSFGLRILLALGLTIGTYKGLDVLVIQIINYVQGIYGGIQADILQILNLSGFGESLGIVLGAFVSRAAIKAAGVFAGSIRG